MLSLRLSPLLLLLAAYACSSTPKEPSSPVHGLLTEITVASSGDVSAFTMRADDGHIWNFAFRPEAGAQVDAQHLQLHIAQQLPVLVSFTGNGAGRVAQRIDDG